MATHLSPLHPALKTQLKSNPIQPQNRASRTTRPQNEPQTRGANHSTEPVYVGQLPNNPTFSPCAIPNNKNPQILREPITLRIRRKSRNLISTTTYVTVTPSDESPQADLPIRSPTCQKNGKIGLLRPLSPSETPLEPRVWTPRQWISTRRTARTVVLQQPVLPVLPEEPSPGP